jgi:osmoprotectant transport system substrate-binding protein
MRPDRIPTPSTPSRPRRGLLAASLGAALLLSACGGGGDAFESSGADRDAGAVESEPITVGGASFTESLIMIEMYAALLEDAGYEVQVQPVDNRELYAPELESGGIDVVPEYAATFAEYLNLDANGPAAEPVATGDVEETVTALRTLAEAKGIEVLEPSEAANQNAFFVTEQFAADNALSTLSDLGASGIPVVLAGTAECPERPKCEIGLRETYGIDITEDLPLGFGSVQNKEAVTSARRSSACPGRPTARWAPSAWSCSRTTSSCRTPTTWCRWSTPRAGRHRRGGRGAQRAGRRADHRGPGRAQPPGGRGPRGGGRRGPQLPGGQGPARRLSRAGVRAADPAQAGSCSPAATAASRTLPAGASGQAHAGS